MDFFLLLVNCLLCLIMISIIIGFLAKKPPSPKLPPGPARLPIIGNLHNLGDKPHRSLADLAKVHGPLMSLKLGQVTTIVASSPAVAREILQKHDKVLSNHDANLAMQALHAHELSLPWIPTGPKWRHLRKICNSHIFATQKLDSSQDLRGAKILELLQGVRRNASERPGKAIDVGRAAFRATLNTLSTTFLSLDLADEERSETAREFKEFTRGIIEECVKPNLGDFFPVLAKFDVQGIQRRIRTHFVKLLNLFEWVIDERLRKLGSESYVSANDTLDALLTIGDDGDSRQARMDSLHIKHLFMDLFIAGTDTTSNTLEWAMAELVRNPSTLAKAREELEQTIGKDNHLKESDVSRLPYLQAIMKENFRLHPTVPLLLPHKAGADVEISGFVVPKGVQILINVWAIGQDPTIWDNPSAFIPERFLSSEVDVKGNNFELIPFGAGRRICPGSSLALRMLHMMLGSLIHLFEWKLPHGIVPEKLDMEEKFGLALQKAKPLLIIPIPRS